MTSSTVLQLAASAVGSSNNLEGYAAIIAAGAGMFSAITALVLGLRSSRDSKDDAKVAILMEMLEKQMKDDGAGS